MQLWTYDDDITLAMTPVQDVPHGQKREAERRAVQSLLDAVFGRPVTLNHNILGAPYVNEDPDVCLSISHTGGCAAVAVSRRRTVGIDIERFSDRLQAVIYRICTPGDVQALQPCPPEDLALKIWTAKEAAFKIMNNLEDPAPVFTEIRLTAPDVAAHGYHRAFLHFRRFGDMMMCVAVTTEKPRKIESLFF